MHRPRPFFHFEDLLDVSNTGDVASKTLVLLRQNEGLCEIIKNRLKMTSRNNKKRGVDAAKKKQDVALFFRCLGLQKSSSRVGAVTICENGIKKAG